MDLAEALHVMNSQSVVAGQSDWGLADDVQAEVDELVAKAALSGHSLATKPMAPAAGVDGGLLVRPVEAMLRLARATRALVSDDVYDWYRHWGWLRYLGVFDQNPAGRLRLSDAGVAVRANQRRVMSEDLGIGFGCLVAERWCRAMGAASAVTIVDVDLALNEGRRWLQLQGAEPKVGKRQPDYILIYPDTGRSRTFTYRALECKGTVSSANAPGQLARAATQLGSLELGGASPQGIAVSTVSNRTRVRYLAVDPDEGDDRVVITNSDLARARQPIDVQVTAAGIVSIDAGDFVAGSLLMANGTLADYAGNNEAASQFLPPPTLTRLARRPRVRVTRETAEGVFRGVEYRFSAPDGTPLEIFMGVAQSVDDGLVTGDLDEVVAAQSAFRADPPEESPVDTDTVSASADDGAILMLRAGTQVRR